MRIRRAMDDMGFMRRLFPAAELEAVALGDEVPGPEHLMLAASLMRDDTTARDVLDRWGVSTDDLRQAIGRVHADALRTVGVSAEDGLVSSSGGLPRRLAGPYRSSGAAQVVFQRAVTLSKTPPRIPLSAAHILLAVAEQEHGTAARALADLEVDRSELLAAVRAQLQLAE